MPRSNMPNRVLLLAVVWFLIAGGLAVIAGLFAIAPAALQSWGFRPNPGTSVRLWGVGFFGGTAALAASAGSGLWRLKRWARRFVMSNAVITLFGIVMSLSTGRLNGAALSTALFTSASVVFQVATLWYLSIPDVQAQFGSSPRTEDAECSTSGPRNGATSCARSARSSRFQ